MGQRNIILVGFMGTGKTASGRVVAERTGLELVDMDSIIVERAGRSIADIFATDGEAAFRAMERQLVQELSQREGLIVATGGGVVLNPANLSDFERNGLIICLTSSPEVILRRLERDTTRPLLSGNKKEQIQNLLNSRKSLYGAIRHQINVDQLTPEEGAEAILNLYALETSE